MAMELTGAEFSEKKEGEFNTEGTEGAEFTGPCPEMKELERSEDAASGNELEREENMGDGSMNWRRR